MINFKVTTQPVVSLRKKGFSKTIMSSLEVSIDRDPIEGRFGAYMKVRNNYLCNKAVK